MKRDVTTQALPRAFYSQFPELQTRGLDPHTRGRVLRCKLRADTEPGASMRFFAIKSAVASAHRSLRKACTASAGSSRPKSSVESVKIPRFILS